MILLLNLVRLIGRPFSCRLILLSRKQAFHLLSPGFIYVLVVSFILDLFKVLLSSINFLVVFVFELSELLLENIQAGVDELLLPFLDLSPILGRRQNLKSPVINFALVLDLEPLERRVVVFALKIMVLKAVLFQDVK